jgi:hypothetical protein
MIGPPLMAGLRLAFYIAAGMSLIAAVASLLRGPQTYAGAVSLRRGEAAGPSARPKDRRQAAE